MIVVYSPLIDDIQICEHKTGYHFKDEYGKFILVFKYGNVFYEPFLKFYIIGEL